MTNPNIFTEQGTGENVCPSGCLGIEQCEKRAAIELLTQSTEKLAALTRPEVADTIQQVRGDHLPIAAEKQFSDSLKSALSGSCLRYHFIQQGLTNSD